MDDVFRLLHQIAVSQPAATAGNRFGSNRADIDAARMQDIYQVGCIILEMISSQRQAKHGYTAVESMLTEACQLYIWIGPSEVPQQAKLMDLFSKWLREALLPLVYDSTEQKCHLLLDVEMPCSDSKPLALSTLSWKPERSPTDNAILWGLSLGAIVSSTNARPEHEWFKDHFRSQARAMGVRNRDELDKVFELFPGVTGYHFIEMWRIDHLFDPV